MLKNASFELGQDGHACQVHRPDGVHQMARGEVDKPREWTVFYVHDKQFRPPWDADNHDGWCEPEVKIIPKQSPFLDPPRISAGSHAIKFFTMWRIHQAGLYQTVKVNPGERLRFTIDAHAWSSNDDNPQTSDGVGTGAFYALEGTETNDARRNFTFKVGIDPTGGTDPFADTVIWGEGAHVYNVHHTLPAVEAVAQGQHVTVFVIDQVLWRLKHNDAYFDNARLEIVTSPQPQPQPGQCPTAREPYERTYALLPPGYGHEWISALKGVWEQHHFTIGAQADDAFARVNGVRKCTVLALNPSAWDVDLEMLYQRHYPSRADSVVHYVPIEASTPAEWAKSVRAYHEAGPEPEPEEEPTIPADVPHFDRGTRIGYHTIIPRQVPQHVVALAQRGAVVPVCKFVDDWSGMNIVKAGSPHTLIVGRKTFGGDEGVGGLPQMNEAQIEQEARRLMSALYTKCVAERQFDGDRLQYIDYLESPVNEADPPSADGSGYAKLAKLMIYIMDIAENWDLPVKKLALFSLNAGTPEWNEMVAMVETGVFERMQAGGHILSLHEGTLSVAGYSMETAPVDLWWGPEHTIPGAPTVPGSGALSCRYRYLLHLIRQRGLYVPILISEFYAGGGYDGADPEEVIQRMAWYDEQIRQDPEVIGVTPFTFGGKGVGWDRQDYDFMLPRLFQYTLDQKDRQNA